MRNKVAVTLGVALVWLAVEGRPAAAQVILWANESSGKISYARTNGTQVTTLGTVGTPQGIAVNPATEQIYWTDYANHTINRMNGNGVGRTVLATVNGEPRGIAVDPTGGKVFWALTGGGYPAIQSANLDGSGVTTLLQSVYQTGQPYQTIGVALDPVRHKVYWAQPLGLVGQTTAQRTVIARANYDGTGVEQVVTGASSFMLAVDPVGSKLYWTQSNQVWRANLDGTNPQSILTSPLGGATRGITLDLPNNRMFVVDNDTDSIFRATLDGTGVQTIVTGQGFPTGIAYSPVPEPSTLALAGVAGAGGLALRLRKRRQIDQAEAVAVAGPP